MLDLESRRRISGDFVKHINNSLPSVASSYLNGYAIALEGWRRGLNLTIRISYEWVANARNLRFTLSDGKGKSYDFNSASCSKMTTDAKRIARKKELTKKALQEKGVPQAEGTFFNYDATYSEMIDYARELGYPVVVKPNDGYGGKGITTNIQNDRQLTDALDELQPLLKENSKIIIEKYYTGYDYRIYVIDDEVIASAQRIPANITGDGKHTIKELIDMKNKIRVRNNGPSNKKKIGIDEELKNVLEDKGLKLDTVLPDGEFLFLKTKANVSSGGESIDVTDELDQKFQRIAVDAVKAIDGLHMGAVDLLIDEEKGTAIVLEINTKPGLDIQMYPTFGKARDIPTKIIDYLFPETANMKMTSRRRMYFDFESVLEMTYKKSVFKSVEIPKIPLSIILKKFVITLPDKKQDRFMNTVQRLAHKYKISGHIKKLPDHMILVMGGNKKKMESMLELIQAELEKSKNYTIKELKRTLPVRQGFDCIVMLN